MLKVAIVFFIIILAIPLISSAQEDDITITRVGKEQGLPVTRVYGITQDSIGFLWITTHDGLYRYDGYNSIVFRHKLNDSLSLSSNFIWDIKIDNHGLIWLNTDGVDLFNPKTLISKHFSLNPTSLRFPGYLRIWEDPSKRIWILAPDTIFRFNRTTEHFTSYPLSTHFGLKCIMQSPGDSSLYWIGTREHGLFRLDIKTDALSPVAYSFDNEHTIINKEIVGVYQEKTGSLIVATKNGADLLNPTTLKARRLINFNEYRHDSSGRWPAYFYKDQHGKLSIINQNVIYKLDDSSQSVRQIIKIPFTLSPCGALGYAQGKEGDVWLCTEVELLRYNFTNGVAKAYRYEEKNTASLSSGVITSLFLDRSGVFWVGTETGGLSRIEVQRRKFTLYRYPNPTTESSEPLNVRSLYEDSSGTLWIGTVSGLYKMQSSTNSFGEVTQFWGAPVATSIHSNIGTILPEKNNSLLLGFWFGGFYVFDVNKNTASTNKQLEMLPQQFNEVVRTTIRDSRGTLWVGLFENGLYRKDFNSDHYKSYRHDSLRANSLSDNVVYALAETRDSNLWIGTLHGLNVFNRETNSFVTFFNNPNDPYSLSHNDIRAIHEDADGLLWIGTNGGGLNKLDRASGRFTAFTKAQGLPDDNIYGILEDDHNNLWISTNNGLCKFNTRTFQIRNYTERDGLQSTEFNTGAYYKNKNGYMYFGGIRGFNVFHPDSIKDNRFIPPVAITAFHVFDQPYPFSSSGVELSYRQNYFSFEFIALNYFQMAQNQYAYRMEGFDNNWHYVGTRRFGSYSNLDPGEYVLHIKASNNDGVWNEQGVTLKIVIHPPFWATWWFRSFVIVLVITTGPIIYTRRLSKLKKEQQRQQIFSRQLMESQERERKRIASELHDSLGQNMLVIKNRAELGMKMVNDPVQSKEQYEEISFAVVESIKEIREITYNLRPYELDRLGLTEAVQAMLNRVSEVSTISFISHIDMIDGTLSKDSEIYFFRIIQEGINNILKHSNATECRVTIQRNQDVLEVTIQDNGKGFVRELQATKQSGSSGSGLNSMEERTRALHGELHIFSGTGKGTTLSVRIPIVNNVQHESNKA